MHRQNLLTHNYALALGASNTSEHLVNTLMISIVGDYRVPTSQYLLLVPLLRRERFYPSYFLNFEVRILASESLIAFYLA